MTCTDAEHVRLTNIRLITEKSPVYHFDNCRNIIMNALDIDPVWNVPFYFTGGATNHIVMKEMNTSDFSHKIKYGKNVRPDIISYR